MKKTNVINSNISRVISTMGHTDSLVIADCGLPIPNETERIDIALKYKTPSFLETLENVLEELEVEEVIIAKEMNDTNEDSKAIYLKIHEMFKDKRIIEVSHEELKKLTKSSKAVIRTGEVIPYANIILKSGVVF